VNDKNRMQFANTSISHPFMSGHYWWQIYAPVMFLSRQHKIFIFW